MAKKKDKKKATKKKDAKKKAALAKKKAARKKAALKKKAEKVPKKISKKKEIKKKVKKKEEAPKKDKKKAAKKKKETPKKQKETPKKRKGKKKIIKKQLAEMAMAVPETPVETLGSTVADNGTPQVETEIKDETPVLRFTDHSSNYNVKEAVKVLRTLKSQEEIDVFTKGEKRITINRAIPAARRRLGK